MEVSLERHIVANLPPPDPATTFASNGFAARSSSSPSSSTLIPSRRWSASARRRVIIAFIVASTIVFLVVGRPVKILILVGALNGLILPISLGVILVAAHKRKIVGDYRHPLALTLLGAVVVISMAAMGGWEMVKGLSQL